MSTLLEIEQAISKLPPGDVRRLRAWINGRPTLRDSKLFRELDEAGWLAPQIDVVGDVEVAERTVPISGEPLSETIIRERR